MMKVLERNMERQREVDNSAKDRCKTVLIVDDDYLVLRLGQEVLGLYGYDVITALTEEEALMVHASASRRIDLAILDLTLKGERKGLEIARTLRDRDPSIKTIISTDFSHEERTANPPGDGVDAYLHKPYAMHTLAVEVQRLLSDTVDGTV
jgi:DNA-binding response OmpR family regulator